MDMYNMETIKNIFINCVHTKCHVKHMTLLINIVQHYIIISHSQDPLLGPAMLLILLLWKYFENILHYFIFTGDIWANFS